MPYLLLTQSALLWRVNHVAGHILAQGANPRHMAEVSWALNEVLLYQWQISYIRQPLCHHNGSIQLILTLPLQAIIIGLQAMSAQGKVVYMSAIAFIALIINRLILHVWLSPRIIPEMISSTADELPYLSHDNLYQAAMLNRFSLLIGGKMAWALSRAAYSSPLRNKEHRNPTSVCVPCRDSASFTELTYLKISPWRLMCILWKKRVADVGEARSEICTFLRCVRHSTSPSATLSFIELLFILNGIGTCSAIKKSTSC